MSDTILGERYQLGDQRWANERETVYSGTDLRMKRPVTLRLPNPERWHDLAWREAVAKGLSRAAPVSHPGLQSILDYDLSGDQPYIVCAGGAGQTLRQRLDAGSRYGAAEVASFAQQAVEALAAIHRSGLVHGGLTPDTVLLAPDGTLQLLDLDRPPSSGSPSLAEARYRAPEQLVGGAADARSDIYSLAAVLYEALAQRPPFDAPDLMALGILKHTARPPHLDELRPDVPAVLVGAIEEALAKDPSERPDSAHSFGESLTRSVPAPVAPPPVAALPTGATTVMSGPQVRLDAGTVVQPVVAPLPVPRPAPRPASAPVERESGGGAGVFIGLMLVAGIAAALYFGLRGGNAQELPSLVGKSQQQAVQALTELGLKSRIAGTDYSEDQPDGMIFKQDPPSGLKYKKDDTVSLWLSKGSRNVEVPPLVNMTEREAKDALKKAGLGWGGSTKASQPDVPDKAVVAQTPRAGDKVLRGTKVSVYINALPKDGDKAAKPDEKKPDDKTSTDPASGVVDQVKKTVGKAIDDGWSAAKERTREEAKKARESAGEWIEKKWKGDKTEKATDKGADKDKAGG